MNELRGIARAAAALAVLALVAALLAANGLWRRQGEGAATIGVTLAGPQPVVTSLRTGGLADRAGLRVGDVVEAIDGRAAGSPDEAERAMALHRPGYLRIRRGPQELDLSVR